MLVTAMILSGCSATSTRVANDPPSFNKGLDALQAKDFKQASFYFAELAKDGDPAAMNNLGVALMMVDRKEEAVFWFKKATRYGDKNAPKALAEIGEHVPPADLVGRHPSVIADQRNSQIMQDIFVATLIGVALGVSLHYSHTNGGTYVPNYNPWAYTSADPNGCSSHYDCGVGERCIKDPFESSGVCMKSVDEYGLARQAEIEQQQRSNSLHSDGVGGMYGSNGTQLHSDGVGGYQGGGNQYHPDGVGGLQGSDGSMWTPDGVGGYHRQN